MLCIIFASTVPVSAIVISPNFAPDPITVFSTTAASAPDNILSTLDKYSIDHAPSSRISVLSLPGGNTSALNIITTSGNRVEETILLSFSANNAGNIIQDNFAEELLVTPLNSDPIEQAWGGVRTKFVTVYERISDGRNYVRPTGQYFTCYDEGGNRPTRVTTRTALGGDLYSKNGSTYTLLSTEYTYYNFYTVNSPAFNTTYSQSKTLSNGQYIVPINDFKGLVLELEVVIDGQTNWWAYKPSMHWY